MTGYSHPEAVFTAGSSSVKVDPYDPAFNLEGVGDEPAEADTRPVIYLFSNSRTGDGIAYAMAEDGTVLGTHCCSHWGYMRHDLHDRPDRLEACQAHYPDGYRLEILGPSQIPPAEVLERNRKLGRDRRSAKTERIDPK